MYKRKAESSESGLGVKRVMTLSGKAVHAKTIARRCAKMKKKIWPPVLGPTGGATETKWHDIAANSYALDTTGSITMLNGIQTGSDAISERVGRSVTWRSICLKGLIAPTDDTVNDQYVEIYLVYDADPEGVIATMTEILNSASSYSWLNMSGRERFRVIRKWSFYIGKRDTTAQSTFCGSPSGYKIDAYVPVCLPTVYGTTGATIASILRGAIYLVTIGSQALNDGSKFYGSLRLRYTDD